MVAQIYGVGLITSRLTGMHFEIGILLGLGGVLVCSFLGGMRAVTWTQVTQYAIIMLAFMVPVSWLAYKQVDNPLAPMAYRPADCCDHRDRSASCCAPRSEQEVRDEYERRVPTNWKPSSRTWKTALQAQRKDLRQRLQAMGDEPGRRGQLPRPCGVNWRPCPRMFNAARERWKLELQNYRERAQPLGGMPRTTQAFAGDPDGDDAGARAVRQFPAQFPGPGLVPDGGHGRVCPIY